MGTENAPDGTNDFVDGADYPDGAAITYQWQKRVNGGAWEDISLATARTYTPTPTLFETTFFRRKSTSNLNGAVCEAISSNIITINVGVAMILSLIHISSPRDRQKSRMPSSA